MASTARLSKAFQTFNSTLVQCKLKRETGPLLLTSTEYMFASPTSNVCLSGIQGGSPSSNVAIIGNVFLRRFIVIFDFVAFKVGFAVANREDAVQSIFVAQDSTNPPVGTWNGSSEVYAPGSNFTSSKVRSSGNIFKFGCFAIIVLLISI